MSEEFTLEEAVRMITYDTSTNWGFHDRGLLREGLVADITVFNPDTVEPRMPTVVHDLRQACAEADVDGMLATVVAGQVVLKENEHTGALGQLLMARWPPIRTPFLILSLSKLGTASRTLALDRLRVRALGEVACLERREAMNDIDS